MTKNPEEILQICLFRIMCCAGRNLSSMSPAAVVSMVTARRRGRAIMAVGRRRTVTDHRGRRHHNRRRCDHCSRPPERRIDKSDDIGCQSDSVISFVMISAVMRSSHCRNCANCCDTQDQCDFHSFHFLYPFFLILCATIYRARSNPITLEKFNLLFLIIKFSLILYFFYKWGCCKTSCQPARW